MRSSRSPASSPSAPRARAPTGWAASWPAGPAAIAPFRREPYRWTEVEPTLEDVFIHLMSEARDNFQ